jgi:SNF2 family DNA or RNA helicase
MQLFPHQQEAKLFLLSRRRAILADQPRVGKTLPTAAAALENLPALIVCPAIAKTVWEAAFSKLAPNVSVHVVNGKRGASNPFVQISPSSTMTFCNMHKRIWTDITL